MSSPLAVEPVRLEDFDIMATYQEEKGGTLTAPLLYSTWPCSTPEATAARNTWSMDQQRWQSQHDSTVHFVKVVDTSTPQRDILALARWHDYPSGFPPENLQLELDVFSKPGEENYPPGLHGPLHSSFLTEACAARAEWEPGPAWVLTTLVTRECHRKRGAGGLLVNWGASKAAEAGAPAYIEAAKDAMSLYQKHGFRHVGDFVLKGALVGMEKDIVLGKMKRDPPS